MRARRASFPTYVVTHRKHAKTGLVREAYLRINGFYTVGIAAGTSPKFREIIDNVRRHAESTGTTDKAAVKRMFEEEVAANM